MAKKKQQATQKPNYVDTRPPIVTIMGHVDHGKTSILDAIREDYAISVEQSASKKSKKQKQSKTLKAIASQESGGITQHIGAYTVEKDGKRVTFIDTPGHEAFTQMRARGGKAADVVILVVAADDGVMPQTKEAIMHAKAANVPIVVAINKCDLPAANPTRVKQQLSESEIFVEGYGGDIVAVEISAMQKTGLDGLLDVLNLIADMNSDQLKADANGNLDAVIIESRHDSKRGVSVSAVVKNGTLKVRDEVISGGESCRIRSLTDSFGSNVTEATLGDAVEILGFSELPEVGDSIRRVGETTIEEPAKDADADTVTDENQKVTAEDGSEVVEAENLKLKKLNLVIRADTSGTLEAVISSIRKLKVEDAEPNILLAGTGEVKESDILLASTGRAVIFAFKVGVSPAVKDFSEIQKIIIREHDIIYKMIEEIEGALEGVVEIEEAKIKGRGLVIETFVLPKSSMKVAGTIIEAGKFKTNQRIGVFRGEDEVPLYISRIRSMHIGPNEAELAKRGDEVGLLFKPPIEDIQLDDRIEVL